MSGLTSRSGLISYVRPGLRARLLQGVCPAYLQHHPRKSYIIAYIISVPYWVDREALVAIAREAKLLSVTTGIPHEVDHIIPLSHPRVCGLTVPWNLQILTQRENGKKGNRWSDTHCEQLLLFTDPIPAVC